MPFVLVHGAGFGADCWDELIPHLTAEALAVDLPGHGRSAHRDLYSFERDADAVLAVIEAWREPVVLVGHSRGGLVAAIEGDLGNGPDVVQAGPG